MLQTNPENLQPGGFPPQSPSPDVVESRQNWTFAQILAEPVSTITDSIQRRQASLVSAISLALVIALSFGTVANIFIMHMAGTTGALGSTAVIMAVVYALSRGRHYNLAKNLLIVVVGLLCVLDATVGNDHSAAGFMGVVAFDIVLILISSVLVSIGTTAILAALNAIGILLVPLVVPEITYGYVTLPVLFNIVLSGIILVATQYRNLSESDRLHQLDNINTSLQASNKALSDSTRDISARTRELELSVEVGRTISQVNTLDVLLKNAAEIIQSRFELYYVQVYLVEPARTALVLWGGTGSVGQELLKRGHNLPLNSASINGRAVMEKRLVLVEDTTANATFRPNPLLPETCAELAVPLMLADRVVGVLDLQSNQPGALITGVLPAFEALAGQLAIAIQNASLLAEAEQARRELESQARRLVRTGWQDYLDALHKPEKLGFIFEQNQVLPLNETAVSASDSGAFSAPIAVTGEPVGTLVVEMDESKRTTNNTELVKIVARQVAQQIENLRLLDSAERYRYEAEQAAHRLTREGWKDYVDAQSDEKVGYLYDLNEVRPIAQQLETRTEKENIHLPLNVRDEKVGSVSVQGIDENDRQAVSLVRQIADRLGERIDSLRQFEQTQTALGQSEKLFTASRKLTLATDLQELMAVTVESLQIQAINRAVLTSLNYNAANELESVSVVANWWRGIGTQPAAIGTRYSVGLSLFSASEPVFVNDSLLDERLDLATQAVIGQRNLRAGAVLPLFLGTRQIGSLVLEADQPHKFKLDETRLITALAPQITTVWENRRQFERAQRQAEREATLNAINQKIQSATSVDAVLQIAARELGHALGAPRTIAQLSLKDSKITPARFPQEIAREK